MGITEKELIQGFGHMEDHQYKHYNRALGCKVESKEHFKHLMDKGGYVSLVKGEKMAEQARKNQYKPYNGLSKRAEIFIREASQMADRKGNINPSGRFIEGLKKQGIMFGRDLQNMSTSKGGYR